MNTLYLQSGVWDIRKADPDTEVIVTGTAVLEHWPEGVTLKRLTVLGGTARVGFMPDDIENGHDRD